MSLNQSPARKLDPNGPSIAILLLQQPRAGAGGRGAMLGRLTIPVGQVVVEPGDCLSDNDNGLFVDGTVNQCIGRWQR